MALDFMDAFEGLDEEGLNLGGGGGGGGVTFVVVGIVVTFWAISSSCLC
jgi:hypothetical protein